MMKILQREILVYKPIIPIAIVACVGGFLVSYSCDINNVIMCATGLILVYIAGSLCERYYPIGEL